MPPTIELYEAFNDHDAFKFARDAPLCRDETSTRQRSADSCGHQRQEQESCHDEVNFIISPSFSFSLIDLQKMLKSDMKRIVFRLYKQRLFLSLYFALNETHNRNL